MTRPALRMKDIVQRRSQRPPTVRCAVYTRKSTEEGLEQEFNTLDAQREAGEAFIASQFAEGWECLPERYDDGGYTGGNTDRPALQRLLRDIEAGQIDCVVVYKVDRLSRSLLDFSRMMELFEQHHISFVSVTQQFNTSSSMGRLILNVLLSFAQFEREMISERTRDKIAAARRKGKWSGGLPLLGYDVVDTKLVVNPDEAQQIRTIFNLYLSLDGLLPVVEELHRKGWVTKRWTTRKGIERGGNPFDKNRLWQLLTNVTYKGMVRYKEELHNGEHEAIVPEELWDQVQAKLRYNGSTGGAAVRNKFGAVLKGLLYCQCCGCAMTPTHSTYKRTKRYRYYTCSKGQKQGRKSCPSGTIPAGEIEQFVVEQIKHIGQDPELVAETIKQVHRQGVQQVDAAVAEQRRLERELADALRQLQALAGSTLTGTESELATSRIADLQGRMTSTENRLRDVRAEVHQLQGHLIDHQEAAKALAQFSPVWEALSLREQGKLLKLLIERIEFDGQEGLISITFQPSGLKTLARQHSTGAAA